MPPKFPHSPSSHWEDDEYIDDDEGYEIGLMPDLVTPSSQRQEVNPCINPGNLSIASGPGL